MVFLLYFILQFSADALGHVIAEDVHATQPLPPFPASIKDGYAVVGGCKYSFSLTTHMLHTQHQMGLVQELSLIQ